MAELSMLHLKDPNFGKIPAEPNQNILRLSQPHLDAFNFCITDGLKYIVEAIPPIEFFTKNGDKLTLSINDMDVGKPMNPLESHSNLVLYPKECIERGSTYKSTIFLSVVWSINLRSELSHTIPIGGLPIMVKSKKCNLYKMSTKELVKHGELVNETGGYFIINGNRKVLRLLISNRRNYPIAIQRKTWKNRDKFFTDKGVQIRCVSIDETVSMNVLHFLSSGGAKFSFRIGREIVFLPVMLCLKVLLDQCDRFIYKVLMQTKEKDIYLSEKVKMMLRELQDKDLFFQSDCKIYVGKLLRLKVQHMHFQHSDEEICDYIFETYVLTHLTTKEEKFYLLCSMVRKLYDFVQGNCVAESVDVLSLQEATLGGYTLLQYIKERLFKYLNSVKYYILLLDKTKDGFKVTDAEIKKALHKGSKIGDAIQNFLATGSLVSTSGCGLMQTTGLSVMMENINRIRDLSHLRGIHRGTYFLEMKSVIPRRLTGEHWGFICPVHTPDGAPCGLLNHLTQDCYIPCSQFKGIGNMIVDLRGFGVVSDIIGVNNDKKYLEVFVDGRLVGFFPEDETAALTLKLREMKVFGKLYKYTEIVYIPTRKYGGQYVGLYLFTTPSRLMRPVLNLTFGEEEFIGSFEQIYLNVAVDSDDIEEGVHTHMELEKIAILSNISKLIPLSDCNPTPRNMYQCQMGKQSMGSAHLNYRTQTSGKTYRLQNPQVSLFRTDHYDKINLEEFCMGFNAVLAIVSYTGYDMEDAMVMNKCSLERGLGHGQLYKSEFIDLVKLSKEFSRSKNTEASMIFKRDPENNSLPKFLDELGLPYPGSKVSEGDPYYCYYNVYRNSYNVVNYKGEDCVIDKCSIMGKDSTSDELQRANITIRIRRDPVVGDKFASRSGQKGILSRLYPMEDLPFSERGITPDIIFNPHGIPSRMTAAKLIEVIAGKAAAEHGLSFDATPFKFNDEDPAYDYFGKILEKAGFNYYGEDTLYSGIDGRMMECKIFEGIVYYQRLRHMTADKWQVRGKGSVDPLTRQPVKGRKRGGAVRFGEMERDCLISHGAAFALKDRMLDCSDGSEHWVCTKCGCLLSPNIKQPKDGSTPLRPKCLNCDNAFTIRSLTMPYAFKYLVTELASVGIKVKIGVADEDAIVEKVKSSLNIKD